MGAPQRRKKPPKPFALPKGGPRGPGVVLPQGWKESIQRELLPMLDTLAATEQDVKGQAAAYLGQPQAAYMMARNDLQSYAMDKLSDAQQALQNAESDVRAQAMGQIGQVIAHAQNAIPDFPAADQLAAEIYPQFGMGFTTPQGAANAAACAGLVSNATQAFLSSCAQANPLGGQGYADCADQAQAYAAQQSRNCNLISEQTGMMPGPHVGPQSLRPPTTATAPVAGPKPPVQPVAHPGGGAAPAPAPQASQGGLPGVGSVPPAGGFSSPSGQPTPGTGAWVPLPGGGSYFDPFAHATTGTIQTGPMPPGAVALPAASGAPPGSWYLPTPLIDPNAAQLGLQPQGGLFGTGPAPVTTDTFSSGSAGSAGASPAAACDMNKLLQAAQATYDATYDIEAAAASVRGFSETTVYVGYVNEPCDAGYVKLGVMTANTPAAGKDLCVKCSGQPIVQSKGCCPVNVTVNCPPSPPTATTPKPGGSPAPVANIPPTFEPTTGNFRGVSGPCGLPFALGAIDWNPQYIFSQLLGLRAPNGMPTVIGAGDKDSGLIDKVLNAIMGALRNGTDEMSAIFAKLVPQQGCFDPNYVSLQTMRMIGDLVSKYIGDGLEGLTQKATQQARNLCPSMVPSPDNAIEAYLTNQIDMATALCWSRAGNQTEAEWKQMIEARKSRLDANTALTAWRRGMLDDKQVVVKLREQGWLDDQSIAILGRLTEQVPPASDLVSFMVRDVEDPNIVGPFGLDDEFGNKYQGKVKEWAYQQGLSDDYMKRVWRAHWSIPAPTQLYEFWHKLRRKPKYNGNGQLLGDIEKALKQQDILPFWVPYFMDSSYRVPTRVDVRRMYNQGALTKQRVEDIYVEGGYSDDDAKALADFAESEKRKKYMTDPAVKQYQKGLMNDAELRVTLQRKGADEAIIDAAILEADWQRTLARRDVCHKAWRKRFLAGELKRHEVMALLIGDGLNQLTAQTLTDAWECEKKHTSKTIPAGKACQLFSASIITAADFFERLQNIGYSSKDALAMVADCELRLNKTRAAEVAKRIKQQEAQARKEQTAAKQYLAQIDKRSNAQQEALNKARAVSKNRRHLVLETAFAYAGKTNTEPGTAAELVNETAALIAQNGGHTLDSVLMAGPGVVKLPSVLDPDSLIHAWTDTLQGLQHTADDPGIDPTAFLPPSLRG